MEGTLESHRPLSLSALTDQSATFPLPSLVFAPCPLTSPAGQGCNVQVPKGVAGRRQSRSRCCAESNSADACRPLAATRHFPMTHWNPPGLTEHLHNHALCKGLHRFGVRRALHSTRRAVRWHHSSWCPDCSGLWRAERNTPRYWLPVSRMMRRCVVGGRSVSTDRGRAPMHPGNWTLP